MIQESSFDRWYSFDHGTLPNLRDCHLPFPVWLSEIEFQSNYVFGMATGRVAFLPATFVDSSYRDRRRRRVDASMHARMSRELARERLIAVSYLEA